MEMQVFRVIIDSINETRAIFNLNSQLLLLG